MSYRFGAALLALVCSACGDDRLRGVPEPPVTPVAECPAEVVSTTPLDAGRETAWDFTGRVAGAQGDGTFLVRGPEGEEVRGAVPTDTGTGDYEITIPLFCGAQEVRFSWTVNDCAQTHVYEVTTNNCRPAQIRVTITWDDLGRDWELHLIRPGGKINDPTSDCTWNTCVSFSPDWGVTGDTTDDPRKDVDDLDGYGPENIYLENPADGTYWVLLEHWSSSGDPRSTGSAQLNVGGELTVIPIEALEPLHVRYVATIHWPSGAVTPATQVMDCSGDWASGCQMDIP